MYDSHLLIQRKGYKKKKGGFLRQKAQAETEDDDRYAALVARVALLEGQLELLTAALL